VTVERKLESYPNHAFLVAKSAALQEIDLFWGDDWLVSLRERDDTGATSSADTTRRRPRVVDLVDAQHELTGNAVDTHVAIISVLGIWDFRRKDWL
jgi:hypothetical protein